MNTISKNFKKEFKALLKKYNAEIISQNYRRVCSECMEDIRMTVYIPAVYKDCLQISKQVEIDLCSYISAATID